MQVLIKSILSYLYFQGGLISESESILSAYYSEIEFTDMQIENVYGRQMVFKPL